MVGVDDANECVVIDPRAQRRLQAELGFNDPRFRRNRGPMGGFGGW